MLSMWVPSGEIGAEDRARWLAAAERIATGLTVLAHLDAFVDAEHLRVGFSCEGDTDLAREYVWAIFGENVAARQAAPIIPGRTDVPADEVLLPCAPWASDDDIKHVVLATVKASHGLEFDVDVDLEDEAALYGSWKLSESLPD